MKFRKAMSAALAAATLVSSVSVTAYADTAAEAEMKKALTYVKQRVKIPEEYENFEYTTSKEYNRNKYRFTWKTEDGNKSLRVDITGKVITRYNEYDYTSQKSAKYSFGQLSQEELMKKAEEWIKVINPTVYTKIAFREKKVHINISDANATIYIERTSDGIPVKGQTGTIDVDKNTGELLGYNLNWKPGASFRAPEQALGKDEAIEAFENEIPLELAYVTEYDYETYEYTPHLIYRQSKYGEIDAFTGKISTFEESYGSYDYDDDVAEDAADEEVGAAPDNGGVTFTDAELEKMEKEGSLVTAKEALDAIIEMNIFDVGTAPKVTSENCRYNKAKDCYIRDIYFTSKDENYYPIEDPVGVYDEEADEVEVEEEYIRPEKSGSFTINAETGELLNFYSWSNGIAEKHTLTEKNAVSTMKKYLKKIVGEKASEFTFNDPEFNYSKYENGKPVKNSGLISAYCHAPRYAYGIPCDTENVRMEITAADKKISSFNISYYGIEYPEPDNIVTEEAAFDSYFETVEYDKSYRLAVKEEKVLSALVYATGDRLYVDAFSGKRVNGDGGELYVNPYSIGYTDIADSKYREIAELLAEYDIYLMDEDGRLNENEYITRAEFSSFVSQIGCWYYNEKNGDSVLTRQFAAKIFTNHVISEECAAIKGIFKTPFTDVKDSNKYIAYIAIADGLGYMEGTNGKFRPGAKVTRGEALKLVYDYLAE